MTTPATPLTPQQAYNKARAEEQTRHRYTTEGIHVVCACGAVATIESIAVHVEEMAEAAGVGARNNEITRRAKEYEAAEAAKKRRADADLARARAEVKQQDQK